MLYLKNQDACVIVLGEADLITLRERPLGTPDGRVLFAYSPDLPWVAAAIKESQHELTPQKIAAIIATSVSKPAQA
jgi:hypothetical protein